MSLRKVIAGAIDEWREDLKRRYDGATVGRVAMTEPEDWPVLANKIAKAVWDGGYMDEKLSRIIELDSRRKELADELAEVSKELGAIVGDGVVIGGFVVKPIGVDEAKPQIAPKTMRPREEVAIEREAVIGLLRERGALHLSDIARELAISARAAHGHLSMGARYGRFLRTPDGRYTLPATGSEAA